MKLLATGLAGSVLAMVATSTAPLAQSYYDDHACRQYADAQVAPLRGQSNAQAFGSALLGAGVGAAIGGAVGGGRGAGIGAASGAVVGGGVGAASAQNTAAYLQQQYSVPERNAGSGLPAGSELRAAALPATILKQWSVGV